jgi:hypothetical protein
MPYDTIVYQIHRVVKSSLFCLSGAKRADFRRGERRFVDVDTGKVEAGEQ